MITKKVFILLVSILGILHSCGANKKSGRDAKREQIRNNAETKRKELQNIEGKYFGQLLRESGDGQNVTLNLEIKDVPDQQDGEIDSLMIPTLTGYMKFNYGTSYEGEEELYIGFGITKAEFDPKSENLDFVVSNETYKSILIKLVRLDNRMEGRWSAPDLSQSGKIILRKSTDSGGEASLTDIPMHKLAGDYEGYSSWSKDGFFQYCTITIRSSFNPPDNIGLDATTRLYFGGKDSEEYLTYSMDDVQFNPIDGGISITGSASDISFQGKLVDGRIQGSWSSKYIGNVGSVKVSREAVIEAPKNLRQISTLRGTYQGTLTNTHPESQFPERILFSVVTSEDQSDSSGIKISGNIRFYIGSFESLEYFELPFSHITFNFYTRQLVAKTRGDYNLTLKGAVTQSGFTGKLFYDALGEVADLEVLKQ